LAQQGRISWDGVAEFGDLLAGKVPVPDVSNNIIVFRDSQGGYGDVALAAWVYEEARSRGLGQETNFE
jgi:ornithine cyclodeaminase